MSKQTLIALIQNSPSLTEEEKSLLSNALHNLTTEESETIQEALNDEEDGGNQIQNIYSERKRSLLAQYSQTFKTIKRWALHEGEKIERETEQNRLNTLLDNND